MDDDTPHLIDRGQIRTLLAIAEQKSFSAAAATLEISQPSISQQVKRIELKVGRTLFRRRHFGIELTNDGEAVVVYAKAMLALGAGLRKQLARNEGHVRINVGMSQDVCRTALPTVFALFARDHPDVALRIISGTYNHLANAIDTGCVDIAVHRRTPRLPSLEQLWTDKLQWVGHHALALPVKDPVPLCIPTDPNPGRDACLGALETAGRFWRVALESDNLASIEAALQARLGVGTCPRSMRYYGVGRLDEAAGLPPLPSVDFVMLAPDPSAQAKVHAFAAVIRLAAQSRFRVDPI